MQPVDTFFAMLSHALYGTLLIAVYGIGHCSIIVLAGASTRWVGRYLRWTDASRAQPTCGMRPACSCWQAACTWSTWRKTWPARRCI